MYYNEAEALTLITIVRGHIMLCIYVACCLIVIQYWWLIAIHKLLASYLKAENFQRGVLQSLSLFPCYWSSIKSTVLAFSALSGIFNHCGVCKC